MTVPIRVLLVDDDPLVLSGLKIMLAAAKQIHVVGEAHDGREVLPAVDMYHPDVVLMDIRMPRLDGIAATRLLHTQPTPPPPPGKSGRGAASPRSPPASSRSPPPSPKGTPTPTSPPSCT